MSKRFLATTALVLSLALPAAAAAGQSPTTQSSTKVEQSTSVSASSRLLDDAKAQVSNAVRVLGDLKDAAGEQFAAARENARSAVGQLADALEAAKADIAEASRDAYETTTAKIAEARILIDDQKTKPKEIASSLESVGEAVGEIEFEGARSADAGAKVDAKSDTSLVGKVGSALGLGAATGTATKVTTDSDGWRKVELIGQTVYGADQEAVGTIDDVVMAESGKVESVLVDVGGFLGIGAKKVAIPVANLEVQGTTIVAAGLNRRQAEEMPEYQRQQQ